MEYFDVYDESGNHVGTAPRSVCHGNPALIHRTAHVVVFNRAGDALLLQKRAMTKDIQPGKWDTAVGGHLALGEDYETGARREMREELGVEWTGALAYLFDEKIRNEIESEDVRVYSVHCDGPFDFQREEIDEVRFWSVAELRAGAGSRMFTPNLNRELARLFAEILPEK